MLLTICTVRQLPQALALGDSFCQFAGEDIAKEVLIGLVDSTDQLPPGFTSPYPIVAVSELLPANELAALSAQYTPTEFAAACKPLFIAEAFRRFPETNHVVYAAQTIQFLAPLAPLWSQLAEANILLTPFITRKLSAEGTATKRWPDEKFFQNIGLYTADFLAFRRAAETDRMVSWWDDRVRHRAYINFCDGLCLDQLWLMHVPVFFRGVAVIKNPGWHLGLWNLPERTLTAQGNSWLVSGAAEQNQPLLFVNFKGLLNPDEGFFPHLSVHSSNQSPVKKLVSQYRRAVDRFTLHAGSNPPPAYGHQPEPPVLRGWRSLTHTSMQAAIRFIDRVQLPAFR